MLTLTTRGVLRKADLRESNERLILNLIRQNPDMSRSDIVRMTGLSASSVTFIVGRLIKEGFIAVERRNGQVQAGRPPIALRLRPEAMYAVGAEITMSRTRVAAADVRGGILAQKVVPWHANPEVFLARVRGAIRGLVEKLPGRRLLGVAVGIAGTVDRSSGKVIAAENLGWFDVEAGRILAEGLPVKPLVENDAKLAAFAERWFCSPGSIHPKDFVFVAARGGLGTGVFVNGHLLQGASGEGSEFGHTVLYPDGRPCVCGSRGCWEEYASGRALERLYRERKRSSEPTRAEEIVRLARGGDAIAVGTLNEIAVYVGLGFVNLRQAFDPEMIIVGNYLADSWDLISDGVWKVLRERVPSRHLDRLRIVPAQHTEDSTLMGALAIVLSQFFVYENVRAVHRTRRALSVG
jgi:predicted NBD/HSP70 family sugar kinase